MSALGAAGGQGRAVELEHGGATDCRLGVRVTADPAVHEQIGDAFEVTARDELAVCEHALSDLFDVGLVGRAARVGRGHLQRGAVGVGELCISGTTEDQRADAERGWSGGGLLQQEPGVEHAQHRRVGLA
jgi:hypothetical protein